MASAAPNQAQAIQSRIDELQAQLETLTAQRTDMKKNNNSASSRAESDQPVGNKTLDVERTKAGSAEAITVNNCRFYNAFIAYAPEDWLFVEERILPLEETHKFKFMIPERDLLPGTSIYETTAEVIEKRCTRVIIILSKNFSKSPACKFQTEFAHYLSVEAQNRRLLPILTEDVPEDELPKILRNLKMCKMTNGWRENLIESLGRTLEVADSDVTHRRGLRETVFRTDGVFAPDMEPNGGTYRMVPGDISVQHGYQLEEMTNVYESLGDASFFRDRDSVASSSTVASSDSGYLADVSEHLSTSATFSGNSRESAMSPAERKVENPLVRLKNKVKKIVKKKD